MVDDGTQRDCYSFIAGDLPLLVSIPHDGRDLAPGMPDRMTAVARRLPDTDWHVQRLYAFANGIGASVLAANYSRYVVDLNRPANDEVLYPGQLSTGICPARTFTGAEIYLRDQQCDVGEQQQRITAYWQPYHSKLETELRKIRRQFGYALLWDAHSIPGEVPLLFDGMLPDLNIGTNEGKSCHAGLQSAVAARAEASAYSAVVNGRFKGGFITRHYGRPHDGIHAMQLELVQRCYMDENTNRYDENVAERLSGLLESMLNDFVAAAKRHLR